MCVKPLRTHTCVLQPTHTYEALWPHTQLFYTSNLNTSWSFLQFIKFSFTWTSVMKLLWLHHSSQLLERVKQWRRFRKQLMILQKHDANMRMDKWFFINRHCLFFTLHDVINTVTPGGAHHQPEEVCSDNGGRRSIVCTAVGQKEKLPSENIFILHKSV